MENKDDDIIAEVKLSMDEDGNRDLYIMTKEDNGDVEEVTFRIDKNGNEVITPSWYADILESHKTYSEESKKKIAELKSALNEMSM